MLLTQRDLTGVLVDRFGIVVGLRDADALRERLAAGEAGIAA